MSETAFTLSTNSVDWVNTTVSTAGLSLSAGVPIDLLVSDTVANTSNPYSALDVKIVFSAVTPDVNFGSFSLITIVEAQDDAGAWDIVGYQFDSLRGTGEAQTRKVHISPNNNSADSGIDDTVFAGIELERISRIKNRIPDTILRVRIVLTENEPGGATSLQSVTISGTGRLHND